MSTDIYAVCDSCRLYAHVATRFAGCERFRSHGTQNKTDDACTFLIEHADCSIGNRTALTIVTEHWLARALPPTFTEVKPVDGARPEPRTICRFSDDPGHWSYCTKLKGHTGDHNRGGTYADQH